MNNVIDLFAPRPKESVEPKSESGSDWNARSARIKKSLERISELMAELRAAEGSK